MIVESAHALADEAVYRNLDQDNRIDDLEAQLADLQASVAELELAQRRARLSSLSRLSPYWAFFVFLALPSAWAQHPDEWAACGARRPRLPPHPIFTSRGRLTQTTTSDQAPTCPPGDPTGGAGRQRPSLMY